MLALLKVSVLLEGEEGYFLHEGLLRVVFVLLNEERPQIDGFKRVLLEKGEDVIEAIVEQRADLTYFLYGHYLFGLDAGYLLVDCLKESLLFNLH